MKVALPSPLGEEETTHPFQPGDWVLVKDLRRQHWHSLRWSGLYQILVTTPTAVKVKEQLGSMHLTGRRPQYRKKEMAKLDLAVLAVLVCSLVLEGLLTSNVTLKGRQKAPY